MEAVPRPGQRALTLGGIAAVAVVFALLAWQRRWLADDGLIVARVARQILAGRGPVYNAFERAEPCTSTLWPYLVALAAAITGANTARVALFLGGACALTGVVVALDATRRWYRAVVPGAVTVPAGALVMLAVVPFADFATSGLETGVSTLWLAAVWWLLVELRPGAGARRQVTTAVVYGVGPLIRPDFALISVVFLVAAWRVLAPTRRRAIALVGVAAVLPLACEVLRAGYFGTLVPLPALAKSATRSEWLLGVRYLIDYQRPYYLWIPAIALVVVSVTPARPHAHPDRRVVAAPIIAGLLELLYVVHLGGDFMHGRMLLPVSFLLLMPYLVLPVQRATVPILVILVAWAAAIGFGIDREARHARAKSVQDEHWYYVTWTQRAHPSDEDAFVQASRPTSERVRRARAAGERRLLAEWSSLDAPLAADAPAQVVVAGTHLGTVGAIVSLDDIAADIFGLANPIGARITPTNPGDIGHEKRLPEAWLLADVAAPDPQPDPAIAAARHAMRCGALAELLASVRAPMTPARFVDNLAAAFARTRLAVPADPFEAERVFCGESAGTLRADPPD